jgi:hypothetical protein
MELNVAENTRVSRGTPQGGGSHLPFIAFYIVFEAQSDRGCETCVEQSILELSDVKYGWSKILWRARALNMHETKHPGAPGR